MNEFDPATRIALSALLWGGLIVKLYKSTLLSRQGSVGLTLAFALTMTLVHCGALVYLNPAYDNILNGYLLSWNYTAETVAVGLETSVAGLLGFTGGVLLANKRIRPSGVSETALPSLSLLKASRLLVLLGAGSTFLSVIAQDVIASLPGMGALMGSFNSFLLLGICGIILRTDASGNRSKGFLAVVGGAMSVMAFNMIATGILGDSVAASLVIISFGFTLMQKKRKVITRNLLKLTAVMYLFIVMAVGWMEIRGQLRAQTGMSARFDALLNAVSDFEIFNPANTTHLELLDMRMNQNVIIGRAVERLNERPDLSARGDTLLLALLGWVPRAVWPGKPTRGGSDTVGFYVDREMSGSSTFGTGPVFEFYINFGLPGVLLGMSVYGFVLRSFDIRSAAILSGNDLVRASYFFVSGVAMITAMNSLIFIVNGVICSFLVAGILVFFVRRRSRRLTADVAISLP